MRDSKKNEKAVLTLFRVLQFDNEMAWKRFDFDVRQSLVDQGLISDPRGRAESDRLTAESLARAKALADRFFGA